jgi:hypothetical protein
MDNTATSSAAGEVHPESPKGREEAPPTTGTATTVESKALRKVSAPDPRVHMTTQARVLFVRSFIQSAVAW